MSSIDERDALVETLLEFLQGRIVLTDEEVREINQRLDELN